MSKNITIRQTTWYLTAAVAGLNIVLSVLFLSFSPVSLSSGSSLLKFAGFQFASFLLIYLIIRYFLESFISKKINFIYKLITERKVTSDQSSSKNRVEVTSLDEVQNEVSKWVEKTNDEISSLKSLEDYRKQYVGVISHELKTPIFTIQGYIHTLIEGGLHDENINLKYLHRAAKNVDRLQTIVDDLELINKLEHDKKILQETDFNLVKLVYEVIQDLHGQAEEKNIEIILNEDQEIERMVNADIESIRQVLINLIANSIKYGVEKGKTMINFHDMGEKVMIEISDDGIGIEKEHLKHLYDRFYRVDHSRSREQGGSGLGLSIVKHIIEAHQQTINVQSTHGTGSTFSFTLNKV